ncbi:MAG: DUF4139 domain-containing protein [Pseudomonadales bacterium]
MRGILLFGLLGFIPVLVSAKDVDANSKIEAVTVYLDGATVTRSARLELPAGDNQIRFQGLPPRLDESRIQVEIAEPSVAIGQVQLATQQRSQAINQEVRDLLAALEQAKLKLQAITDSDKSADLTLKYLENLAGGYAKESWFEGAQGKADVDSWKAAIDVMESGANSAYQRKRDNELARKRAAEEVSKLQRELQATRGGTRASATLEVAVRTAAAVSINARIHYYTPNASWRPVYEARLNSNDAALDLAQRAEVRQNTVEEWQNVQLTLSTSEPEGELLRPQLHSEFLDIAPAESKSRAMLGVVGKPKMVDSAVIEEIVATGSMQEPPSVGNFAVTYPVPGRVSVSNDSNDEQLFDLSRNQFDTQLLTQVVPRRSTSAFLAARFTYADSLPLYSSEMRVYVDGVYAGQSIFPTALPGAEVTLPMGVDRRIQVSAKDQGGEGGQRGIIGKRKTEVTDFLFELTNRRAQSTLVEVFDLYPVSRNKSIEVDVPRTATAPTDKDLEGEPGLIVWRKQLEGGEDWQIRHRYEVSYPANARLERQ